MRKNEKEESYYFSQVSQTFSEVSNGLTQFEMVESYNL